MMKSFFQKIPAPAALCLAAAGLGSCSYCWPSLHTAEAVLHQDTQVVVCCLSEEDSTTIYRYKGKDYSPIQLAYALDKGKDIYRRGDGQAWCCTPREDTSQRFVVQQKTARNYLFARESSKTKGEDVGLYASRLVPEKNFPFAQARRMKRPEGVGTFYPTGFPYEKVQGNVIGMPTTPQAEPPATWKRIVAVPLEAVDFTATVAMKTTEAAGIIAILPIAAAWNGIAILFNG